MRHPAGLDLKRTIQLKQTSLKFCNYKYKNPSPMDTKTQYESFGFY